MYSIFKFVPVKSDTSGSNLQCIVTTVGKSLRILSIMLFCGRENYECVSIDANSTNFISLCGNVTSNGLCVYR